MGALIIDEVGFASALGAHNHGAKTSMCIRTSELSEAHKVLATGSGLLLVGSGGSGKSLLVREAISVLADDRTTFRLCGSRFSGSISYGALAVFLRGLEPQGPDAFGMVLREVRNALVESSKGRRILLSVDHADLLDEESARVLAHLVHSGHAQLLLQCRRSSDIPPALLALWSEGLLHRVDLGPLQFNQARALVQNELAGDASAAMLKYLWAKSEGNSEYLAALVADCSASGKITRRGTQWVLTSGPDELGTATVLAVTRHIDELSGDERELLKDLALSGPVLLQTFQESAKLGSLDRLGDRGLVDLDDGGRLDGMIRLRSTLVSDVLLRPWTSDLNTEAGPGDSPRDGGIRSGLPHVETASLGRVEELLEGYHFEEAAQMARQLIDGKSAVPNGAATRIRAGIIEALANCRWHRVNSSDAELREIGRLIVDLPKEQRTLAAAELKLAASEVAASRGEYTEVARLLAEISPDVLRGNMNVRVVYEAWQCEMLASMGAQRESTEAEQRLVALLATGAVSGASRMSAQKCIERAYAFQKRTRLLERDNGGKPSPDVVPFWPGGLDGQLLAALVSLDHGYFEEALELVTPQLRQYEVWDSSRCKNLAFSVAAYSHAALGHLDEAQAWLKRVGRVDDHWFYNTVSLRLFESAQHLLEDPRLKPTTYALVAPGTAESRIGSIDKIRTLKRIDGASMRGEYARKAAYFRRQAPAGNAEPTAAWDHGSSRNTAPISTSSTRREASRAWRSGWHSSLTIREREVVAELGNGLSNREIALRTSLSVRTVEGHLYQAYAKLQVSGRRELIGLLQGQAS